MEAFGGTISRDQLLLYFGPNERCIGKQYLGDPTVDESAQTLSQFSVLGWLKRFPHWRLGVRLMPAAPPAPGVATFRAAAMSEGKDPDQAVQEARTKGEIPALMDLPAPWGPKPYVASAGDAAHAPAKYPEGFSPLVDTVKPVLAM
ncbi:g6522 [Coccomyxa elongata]